MPMHIQDTVGDDFFRDDVSSDRPTPKRQSVSAPAAGDAGGMSLTVVLLGACVGFLEWILSFALGWIPGVSWIISLGFTTIQTIIIYLDPSSRKLSPKERMKLFVMREGILLVAGLLQGIPIVGEIIPFEAGAMFLLRYLKVPAKSS